jgi:hypothetical protein
MANIQKVLDALQPYVIGIRYLDGLVAVDTVFKEGWVVPDDKLVKKQKGPDETINYYMLFSDSPNVGLDEILAYVDKTIKLNLEKEKKYDLLRAKVDELKILFSKNTFVKLQKLKFTFDEELVPNINEFNLDIEDDYEEEELPRNGIIPEPYVEEYVEPIPAQPQTYLDENRNPLPLTDEDREMLEEEARAERNRLAIKNKKANPPKKTNVELPPRKMPKEAYIPEPVSSGGYCDCGPNEACSKCMDSKDY